MRALRGLRRPLSGLEGPLRPGIVHRLDRGTSGALIAVKTDEAHRELSRLFLAHAILRRYLAVVAGVPPWEAITVDAPIGRGRPGRKAQAVTPDGRPARTRFHVLRRLPTLDLALIEALPETGRKHQIRVHLAHLGFPIAGDTLYGGGMPARRGLPIGRPLLHSAEITGPDLHAVAPLPADLFGVLE